MVWRRAAPYPSFVNFDAPDRMSCVVQRSRTNTPMQALTLLNDQQFVEIAKAFAARILTECQNLSNDDRLGYAFRSCQGRSPGSAELDLLRRMLERELQAIRSAPETAETIIGSYLQESPNRPQDLTEWAAWFCIANLLLNLDETITKS